MLKEYMIIQKWIKKHMKIIAKVRDRKSSTAWTQTRQTRSQEQSLMIILYKMLMWNLLCD